MITLLNVAFTKTEYILGIHKLSIIWQKMASPTDTYGHITRTCLDEIEFKSVLLKIVFQFGFIRIPSISNLMEQAY